MINRRDMLKSSCLCVVTPSIIIDNYKKQQKTIWFTIIKKDYFIRFGRNVKKQLKNVTGDSLKWLSKYESYLIQHYRGDEKIKTKLHIQYPEQFCKLVFMSRNSIERHMYYKPPAKLLLEDNDIFIQPHHKRENTIVIPNIILVEYLPEDIIFN